MRVLRLLFAAKTATFRTVPLLRDTRVPAMLKIVSAVIALAIVSPIDVFGDVPVLGALDDAALLTLLCMWFVSQAAKHVEPIRARRSSGSALAVR